MLSSAAIALSTLPMPPEAHLIYPFSGPSYGGILSCSIQGFVFSNGYSMVLMLGLVLNVYYVCKLRYNMDDAVFSKFIEPVMYAASFFSVIIPGIFIWKQDGYNPTPHDPYCAMREFPQGCTIESNPQCRGDKDGGVNAKLMAFSVLFLGLASLFISTVLIATTYANEERHLRQHLKNLESPANPTKVREETLELQHLRSWRKIVTKQSFLYLGAFVSTWSWVPIEIFSGNHKAVGAVRLILFPSQGIFNLLIFLYHKIHVVRKGDEDLTFWEAFQKSLGFSRESTDIFLIHNLDFISASNIRLKIVSDRRNKTSISACAIDASDPLSSSKRSDEEWNQQQSVINSDPDISYAQSSKGELSGFDGISFDPSMFSKK